VFEHDDHLDQIFQQQELDKQYEYLLEALRDAAACWTEEQLAFVCMSCGVDQEDV
jgi:hypothetical protein